MCNKVIFPMRRPPTAAAHKSTPKSPPGNFGGNLRSRMLYRINGLDAAWLTVRHNSNDYARTESFFSG